MYRDKKLIILSICALSLLSACDEGEYNDLTCDAATYIPECLDGVHLMKCEHDMLVVEKCSSSDHCKNSGAEGAKCVPNYSNNSTDQTPNPTEPPPGTDNPPSETCQDGAVQCDGDYVQTCHEQSWKTSDIPCEFGCQDGVCKTEDDTTTQPETVAECDDATPCEEGFSCNMGACVPTGMLTAENGDLCPEDWYSNKNYEVCTEDGKTKYCGYNAAYDVVIFEETCENGCQMAFARAGSIAGGYDFYTAVCKNDTECQEDGTEYPYCVYDEANEVTYASKEICLPTTDGGFIAADLAIWSEDYYTLCLDTCNEEGTACNTVAPESCEYEAKCEENTFLYCWDLSSIGFGILSGVQKCGESNAICDTINGETGCWETCTEIGATSYHCVDDDEFLEHTLYKGTCTDFGDGRVYVNYETTECGNICDADAAQCVLLEPGEACAPGYFREECSDNHVTLCSSTSNEVVLGENCSEYGEDYVCAIVDGMGSCLETCQTEGKTKSVCEYDDESAIHYDYICQYDNLGNLVWTVDWDNGGNYDCSSNECADDENCLKLVDNEGEACDADMTESCSDNIVVYCEDGVVTAIQCEFYESRCGTTEIDGVPYADCFNDALTCTEVGAKGRSCMDSMFYSYETHYECMETSLGLYYVPLSIQYCDDSCDESTHACE